MKVREERILLFSRETIRIVVIVGTGAGGAYRSLRAIPFFETGGIRITVDLGPKIPRGIWHRHRLPVLEAFHHKIRDNQKSAGWFGVSGNTTMRRLSLPAVVFFSGILDPALPLVPPIYSSLAI
jgi:hypothetical protein